MITHTHSLSECVCSGSSNTQVLRIKCNIFAWIPLYYYILFCCVSFRSVLFVHSFVCVCVHIKIAFGRAHTANISIGQQHMCLIINFSERKLSETKQKSNTRARVRALARSQANTSNRIGKLRIGIYIYTTIKTYLIPLKVVHLFRLYPPSVSLLPLDLAVHPPLYLCI